MRAEPRRVACLHQYSALYGSEQSMLVLLRHLDRRAFAPELILPTDGPLVGVARADGITVHVLPWLAAARSRSRWERLRTAVRLGRWLRRQQMDVLHLNMWENGDGGTHLLAARLAGAGFLLGIRCQMDDYLDRRDQFWLSRTERVVSVSPEAVQPIFSRRRFDRFWHVRPARVSVIPPGRNLAALREMAAASDEMIAALGLRPDWPIVGTVAAITPNKRPDLFLRAAALVAATHPNVQFLLIGDLYASGAPGAREYAERIRTLATELGLGDRTVFAGFRTDAVPLMKRFSVLAVTSLFEGHSGVAIEAMALDVPVVSAAVGGVSDALADGRFGTIVRTSEPADYAAAITSYLDRSKPDRFAHDAERTAGLGRYDALTTTRQFESLYRSLIDD